MISDLLTLGVAGAAAHFLLYRALVTRWLWSRYPHRLDAFVACSACTGFWVGLGIGFYWRWSGTDALGLHADLPALPVAAGAATMVVSPAVAWVQIAALERLGVPETETAPIEPTEQSIPEHIALEKTQMRPLLELAREDAEKTEG